VRAVQRSLPGDPNAPGITAPTRPVGSINSKNGAVVTELRPGRPVEPTRVEAYVRDLAGAPFRTVATTLLGGERAEPCPVCRKPGFSLRALDRAGRCYGCGKVSLRMLFDAVYRPFEDDAPTGPDAEGDAPAGPVGSTTAGTWRKRPKR
jgi:hypothetical protein